MDIDTDRTICAFIPSTFRDRHAEGSYASMVALLCKEICEPTQPAPSTKAPTESTNFMPCSSAKDIHRASSCSQLTSHSPPVGRASMHSQTTCSSGNSKLEAPAKPQTSIPSPVSSRNSRRSAVTKSSPASTLPPGHSQQPAKCLLAAALRSTKVCPCSPESAALTAVPKIFMLMPFLMTAHDALANGAIPFEDSRPPPNRHRDAHRMR